MLEELGYAYFQRTVRRLTGVDLNQYRQGQMRRRLEALLKRVQAKSFLEYSRMLERDPARLQQFRDYFTINVSEFLRDPDRYRFLQTRVIPPLLAKRPNLKVWSAGCSIGAEAYSVAILLREQAPLGAHRVLATDVDATVLARARRGDGYAGAELRNVESARLKRFFQLSADGSSYGVKPELRSMVDFREHNLLGPTPPGGFDLICCRNVVIYFTDDAKRELYRRFADALRPDGFLFVGGTEIVQHARQHGLNSAGASFYQKQVA